MHRIHHHNITIVLISHSVVIRQQILQDQWTSFQKQPDSHSFRSRLPANPEYVLERLDNLRPLESAQIQSTG